MKTDKTSQRLSHGLLFLLCLFSYCLTLASQTPPRLAKLDWRNLQLQERHAAFEAATQEGKFRKAAALAQVLIDSDLAPSPDQNEPHWPLWNLAPDPTIKGLYFSPRYSVSRRLQSGSPETQKAYQGLFGSQAATAFKQARKIESHSALKYVASRFAATQSGADAMTQLAMEELESGNYGSAQRQFMDLADIHWQADGKRRRIWRMALKLAKSMGKKEESSVRASWPSGLAQAAPHGPNSDIVGKFNQTSSWEYQLPPHGGEHAQTLLQPIVTPENVVFHSAKSCISIDRLTGKTTWQVVFGSKDSREIPSPSTDPLFDDYRGALTPRDYLFVTSETEEKSEQSKRTIWAFNRESGSFSWCLRGAEIGSGIPPLLFDASPLVHQGTVYLTATDNADDVASYVLALEATNGRLKWVTKIGTGHVIQFHQSNNEIPNPRKWLGCLPLAMVDGFLVCCDNLGHIAAFEPDTGRPRFLFIYNRRNLDIAGHLQKRSITRGWERNPILGYEDRFVVAADDSDELQAFFVRPPKDKRRRRGNLNFLRSNSLPRHRMRQLLSFDGEAVVLAGEAPMLGLSLVQKTPIFDSDDQNEQWNFPLATKILGRGYSGAKQVYVSTHKYVYPLDLRSGKNAGVLVKEESNGSNLLGHVIIDRFGMIVAAKNAIRFFAQEK